MKQVQLRHRYVKGDDNGHESSADEVVADVSRAHVQQGGGHRSGSSGAGTSEKVDREPGRKEPRAKP